MEKKSEEMPGLLFFKEILNLKSCTKITDDGLEHLENLTNLGYLILTSCSQISDSGLAHLSKLTNLGTLR